MLEQPMAGGRGRVPAFGGSKVKRATDIVLSILALLVLAPVMLCAAIAVRLSSQGPVLFRQARLGRHGVPFQVLKFRTMLHHAPEIRNPDGSAFSSSCDPRVTRAGKFLRATSLDELPQFINVLRGEMSLVGPRPDLVDQAAYYTEAERRKLLLKPGITGLAQISGRNSITWDKRKALEVEYVDRQSLLLDLQILVRTPAVLFRKDLLNTESRFRS